MHRRRHSTNLSSIITTLFFITLVTYFAYHAVSGDRGLFAMVKLSQKVEKSKKELEILKAERIHLEHRVQLLSPESLDLDLLDEQARKLLGYSKVGETVYSYEISER